MAIMLKKLSRLFFVCSLMGLAAGCGLHIPLKSAPAVDQVFNASLSAREAAVLYSGDDWSNVGITLENDQQSPGAVFFIIKGEKPSGSVVTIDTSDAVLPGASWTSCLIASSYKDCIITAKAADTDGLYQIKIQA